MICLVDWLYKGQRLKLNSILHVDIIRTHQFLGLHTFRLRRFAFKFLFTFSVFFL